MIFEMRQYFIERGRMADNHARMREHLPSLLGKHGIKVVGRWVAVSGPRQPMFCYIMRWKDFAERERCWGSFYADPEWARVRALTNDGSELVEGQELVFLKPNSAFQPEDSDLDRTIGGVHQLINQRHLVGRNPEVIEFLKNVWIPRLKAAGGHIIGICDTVSGPMMPNIVSLIAWPDAESYWNNWRAFNEDPELIAAFRDQRKRIGTTLFTSSDSFLMEPASYALPCASLLDRG